MVHSSAVKLLQRSAAGVATGLMNVIRFDLEWISLPDSRQCGILHDDVIKWKHFPRNWPFVRGIHRSPVNSPHKGQWRGALMFSLICVWMNGWVNTREAGDLRRYRGHYDVIIMILYNYTSRFVKSNIIRSDISSNCAFLSLIFCGYRCALSMQNYIWVLWLKFIWRIVAICMYIKKC